MDTRQILKLGKSEEVFAKLKQPNIDCIITDPPFGVDNQSNQATTEAGKKMARKIANDESPEVAIATFQRVMDVMLTKTRPECDLYVFTSYQVLDTWITMLPELVGPHGFSRKAIILWEKDGPGMGDTNSPWGMGSEFIFYFQKGRREKTANRRNSVIHIPQVRPDKLIHPHEKPLALLELLIKTSTKPGDWVADGFAGSFSLGRAAKRTGRNALGCEYDKMNYDLALEALESREDGIFDGAA